jgi:hypothetical protein
MYTNESNDVKKVIVSDLFTDIYRNFNVVTQVEQMKQLSRKELYLLLTFCLDKHSDEDPVAVHNFMPFKDEVMRIFDIQDDKETDDKDLKSLIEETGDKYIETDNIVDKNGKSLQDPLTKEQVRDAKIDIINDKK